MKRTLIAAVALMAAALLVALPVSAQPRGKAAAKGRPAGGQLRGLVDELHSALARQDLAALGRLWADGYTFTTSRGELLTKAQRLAAVKSERPEPRTVEDCSVQPLGVTAIVNCRVSAAPRLDPYARKRQHAVFVFVNRRGRWQAVSEQHTPVAELPVVVMSTSLGEIVIELYPEFAPATVANFLGYVDAAFYDGTVFHRVIPGFMIQGGGFNAGMEQKPAGPPIRNEATNGLSNRRGTLAMARTQEIDSATAQFFINHVDNSKLDHGARDFGYAVFGRVVGGLEVLDKIAGVPTGTKSPFSNVPLEPVVIEKVRRR